MRNIVIQAIGILLGLVVIGCGIILIRYMAGEVSRHYTGPAQVIQPTIGALILFFVAALLVAPQSIYKRASIRLAAFSFSIFLAVGSVFGGFWAILFYSMRTWETVMEAFALMFGMGALLALASAATLLIKAFRARKIARIHEC